DLRRVVVDGTPQIPFAVFDCEVPAVRVAADVLDRPVGLVEEAVFDHHRGAMADQAIAFHLAEPEAALAGPAFRRLACEDLDGAAGADVELPRDPGVALVVASRAE